MRLLLFSPVALSSAIGRVTKIVVAELLERGHDVTVVRTEDSTHINAPAHAIDARIVRWDDEATVESLAEAADSLVYQVGDNYQFHRGFTELAPRFPGVVCLHDFFVGNLFRGWARQHMTEAQAVLGAWYGEAIARRYFDDDPRPVAERTIDEAPLTEWAASMALGVLTHSSWGVARVLAACPGPVRVAALPYDEPRDAEGLPERLAHDRFVVLTMGHANPNKRIASVIRAIGGSDQLRDRTDYRLVGPIRSQVRDELEAQAASLGVNLTIAGEVTDIELRRAIDEADVICNLRSPALEAASASAIEALLCGKPLVVMDTGFYRELPARYVRKVSPADEVAGIRAALESLDSDSVGRAALGQDAAEWARATFRADRYAEALVRLCRDVGPIRPVLQMTDWLATTLAGWGGGTASITATEIVEPLRIFEG